MPTKRPARMKIRALTAASKRLHKDSLRINQQVAKILRGEHGIGHRPGTRKDFCVLCQMGLKDLQKRLPEELQKEAKGRLGSAE